MYIEHSKHIILAIYIVMFLILFLENSLIPAAFLPGDSLLLFAGNMIASGKIDLYVTLTMLVIASSLGCWIGYLQGKLFSDSKIIKKWISNLPSKYVNKVNQLLSDYGIAMLLIGRFITLVRTIIPIIAGILKLKNRTFQIYNLLSSIIWVNTLLFIGYFTNKISFLKCNSISIYVIFVVLILVLITGLFYGLLFIKSKT